MDELQKQFVQITNVLERLNRRLEHLEIAPYPIGGGGGIGDMYKSVYDTNDDGIVNSADYAATAPWSGISGAPTSFPSSPHDILSSTHGDATAGAVQRGDLISGQGASAKWGRLAKGILNSVLQMGADEPGWSAGTLDLGGFALSVPASGTAALLGVENLFSAKQTIQPATDIQALIVKANAVQAANLQEWQDSSGNVLLSLSPLGRVGIGTAIPSYSIHAIGANSSPALMMEGYNSNLFNVPQFVSRRASGSLASPGACLNNMRLFSLGAVEYDGSSFGSVTSANITIYADGDASLLNRGAYIAFETIAFNSASRYERMRISSNGNVGVGVIPQAKLQVQGDINAGSVLSSFRGKYSGDGYDLDNVARTTIGSIEPINPRPGDIWIDIS